MTPRARSIARRLAVVVGVAAVAYVSAAGYALYSLKLDVAVSKEVSDVLASDAVAWVPEGPDLIQVVWLKEKRRETLADRASLSKWLCSAAVRARTSVLIGQTERAQGLLELQLVELRTPPLETTCRSTARFYAVRDSLPRRAPG